MAFKEVGLKVLSLPATIHLTPMPTLYLTEQGSSLHIAAGRLRVERHKKVSWCGPLAQVENVLVFGNVQITTSALSALMAQRAEVAFLSMHGRLKGRLMPGETNNMPLRLRQFERYHNDDFKRQLASRLITGKIRNARINARRWMYKEERADLLLPHFKQLQRFEKQASKCAEIPQLLGLEGKAAREYFAAMQIALNDADTFHGRTRPAMDPINALLNLGYSLLGCEIAAALGVCGLDSYLGFVHVLRPGRPALALDLIEEFRAPLVDRLVVAQWNLRAIEAADFLPDKKGWRLRPEALKLFLSAYDEALNAPFKDMRNGKKVTFRQLFMFQARHLAAAVRDDGQPYQPFRHR